MNGTDLKEWRKRLSFSQDKAATEIGCARRSIQEWEKGVRPVPRYIALACAALALGVTDYPPRLEAAG
jgi:DNA-binding XRE family transcriptional regulator